VFVVGLYSAILRGNFIKKRKLLHKYDFLNTNKVMLNRLPLLSLNKSKKYGI